MFDLNNKETVTTLETLKILQTRLLKETVDYYVTLLNIHPSRVQINSDRMCDSYYVFNIIGLANSFQLSCVEIPYGGQITDELLQKRIKSKLVNGNSMPTRLVELYNLTTNKRKKELSHATKK